MKMIIAILRPEKVDEVKDALKNIGVMGMTFTHVAGRGKQAGVRFTNRVGDIIIDEIEKVKIEIVLDSDELVDLAIDTICRTACTGHAGDGKVFVVPVEREYTISSYCSE